MSERNPDYMFVEESADSIINALTATYESITGTTVHPASPVKVFLSWVASAILNINQNINYAANQNLPSRATGENLDALADLFYMRKRPEATKASTTMRFTISAAQSSVVIVPKGTRVATDTEVYFETVEDASITIGQTTVDVQALCLDGGVLGNGFTTGQIHTCVDIFPYYESCTNITTSGGGSDVPTDDEFFEMLKDSEGAWSCAGPENAYKYFAKSVSSDIVDVVINSPNPGEVEIFALMNDGTAAGSAVKSMISAACNDKDVRPLTDTVIVGDPDETEYDITFTYYMNNGSDKSAAEIAADVSEAVNNYILWQAGKLGRSINPSKLIQMIMDTGVKRVVLTAPTFVQLSDGSDGDPPELAKVGTVTVTNGGYEDE